ncbi:hypothetical protein [Phytoactinopolyspora mesophila]|uniref:Uncharacterized protein n=1 Tax=Phytoactinopolyspora mesophila TaxID=2650750 RepID=A0A7K3M5K6_9ACTN|nr:hypothetical protein [Phytoactinopolyspora mesophila]NDL58212.1 hypothetical protein [Phytoactinopolyspora mesophila]
MLQAAATDQSGDDAGSTDQFEEGLLGEDIGEPMTMDITSSWRVVLPERGGTAHFREQETGAAEENTVVVDPGGSWVSGPTGFTVFQGDTIEYVPDSGFGNMVSTGYEDNDVVTTAPRGAGWEDDPYYTAEGAGLFYIYRTPPAGTGDPTPENRTGVLGEFNVPPVPDDTQIGEVSISVDQMVLSTDARLDGDQDGDVFTATVNVTLDAGVAETTYRKPGAGGSEVYDEPFTIGIPGEHDGCTINDLISDDEDWPNHGAFLGHLREVTDSQAVDGVITRRKQGSHQTGGAARSNAGSRGGPPDMDISAGL